MKLQDNFFTFLRSLGLKFETNDYNCNGVIKVEFSNNNEIELYFDKKLNVIILNNEDLDFDTFKIRLSELLQIKNERLLAIEWLQVNQIVKDDLINEFESLISDDPDFDYKETEFLDWVFDCVMNVIN